jgi:hypothetical protein
MTITTERQRAEHLVETKEKKAKFSCNSDINHKQKLDREACSITKCDRDNIINHDSCFTH